VLSTRTARQLRDATIELLEAAFSMRSIPRCYKQDKSRVSLVVRQSPASKGSNAEVERSKPLPGDNQRRYSRLRRFSARCSELWGVSISDSATIACSYHL
jgi:hypothetical protein